MILLMLTDYGKAEELLSFAKKATDLSWSRRSTSVDTRLTGFYFPRQSWKTICQ